MTTDVIYKELNADNDDLAPMDIESLCINCHENVSSSFDWEHCDLLGYHEVDVYADSIL